MIAGIYSNYYDCTLQRSLLLLQSAPVELTHASFSSADLEPVLCRGCPADATCRPACTAKVADSVTYPAQCPHAGLTLEALLVGPDRRSCAGVWHVRAQGCRVASRQQNETMSYVVARMPESPICCLRCAAVAAFGVLGVAKPMGILRCFRIRGSLDQSQLLMSDICGFCKVSLGNIGVSCLTATQVSCTLTWLRAYIRPER